MTQTIVKEQEKFTTCPAPYSNYKVSQSGHVQRDGHTLKSFLNNAGYMLVRVTKDNGVNSTVPLHRLLGLTFIPNSQHLSDIDHVNSNILDNRLSNLRWVSHRENLARRRNNSGCYRAVICKDSDGNTLGRFDSIHAAATEMGVNPSSVRSVLNGWQKSTRSGYVFIFADKK